MARLVSDSHGAKRPFQIFHLLKLGRFWKEVSFANEMAQSGVVILQESNDRINGADVAFSQVVNS